MWSGYPRRWSARLSEFTSIIGEDKRMHWRIPGIMIVTDSKSAILRICRHLCRIHQCVIRALFHSSFIYWYDVWCFSNLSAFFLSLASMLPSYVFCLPNFSLDFLKIQFAILLGPWTFFYQDLLI